MKKFKLIIGSIFSFLGFVFIVAAQSVISSSYRYTWRPPYSQFEAQTLILKWIGIFFLICGLLDLALVLFSKIYTQKTVQDPTSNQTTTVKCPSCGLIVRDTTKTCPKCGAAINERQVQ